MCYILYSVLADVHCAPMGLREHLPKLSADKILRVCSIKFAHCRLWEALVKTHKYSIYCADTGFLPGSVPGSGPSSGPASILDLYIYSFQIQYLQIGVCALYKA
jgi:hypothetical protein